MDIVILADIGGASGLWLGFCMVTLVEFIEMAIRYCFCKAGRLVYKKNQAKIDDSEFQYLNPVWNFKLEVLNANITFLLRTVSIVLPYWSSANLVQIYCTLQNAFLNLIVPESLFTLCLGKAQSSVWVY